MSPTTLTRIGPYTLRADEDADVIEALERSGNKIGLLRACVRLAMNAPLDVSVAGGGALSMLDFVAEDERAIIEKARGRK